MKTTFKLLFFTAVLVLIFYNKAEARPFWGNECESLGVSMAPDGSQCVETFVCTKYRFWIGFGSTPENRIVDCPNFN